MIRAHRSDDVRAAEQAVLASVPGDDVLMQRAAAGLAVAIMRFLRQRTGGVSGRRVVLLVGSGDNGGDALFAGARLLGRGVRVDAVRVGSKVHEAGHAALLAAGGRSVPAEDGSDLLAAADVVVDGVLGIGGRPGLREPAAGLVAALPPERVLAVDLPSGLDPDTGAAGPPHVRAAVTVAFGAAKPCLLLPPASAAAGRVEVVDIGLGPHLPAVPDVERLDDARLAALWPVPRANDDKYRRGVLGVVAGSGAYPGAAVLACGGAVRAGLGMVRYLGSDPASRTVVEAWPEIVAGDGRVQAWLVGSGIDPSQDPDQKANIEKALASGLPCVVDAGALSLLGSTAEDRDDDGASVLLTPHAGELARLLGLERKDVEADPAAAARRAAAETGATILLKGAVTLVVAPSGRIRSQASGPPWLATAGAGDVLAGIAGALLSGGLSALDAGSVAAEIHGRAATLASSGGPITSMDVADAVPATVAHLWS